MTPARFSPGPRSVPAAALGAALALGIVASCARQGTPSGGPPDRLPPEVVRTRPDTFARIDALEGPIRIEFSERISERPTEGTLDDAVLVSPRSGDVRVSHKGDALEVRVAGGIREGVVYRVTVLPVVADLFGNAMPEPFEFLFSTGGEYHPNAVAGLVVDRITGQRVEAAEVAAVPDWTDTLDLAYVSRSDTGGIYALRSLPPGRYRLTAFMDVDRDREPGGFEEQGERVLLLGAADTVLGGAGDIVILLPDTSAARLAQASLEDSMRVGLTFDDYLEPTAPLAGLDVGLEPVPDTTEEGVTMPPPPPGVEAVLHEREYEAWRDSVAEARARADSIAAADSAVAAGDSAAMAAADSAAAAARAADERRAEGAARVPGPGEGLGPPGQAARGEGEPRTLPDGTPLPSQRLVLVLDSPIAPGATYRVRLSGVVNVNGLGGGGGEATFGRDPAPPDTAAAAADTGGVALPDTGAVAPPDTGGVAPPDTGGMVSFDVGVPRWPVPGLRTPRGLALPVDPPWRRP